MGKSSGGTRNIDKTHKRRQITFPGYAFGMGNINQLGWPDVKGFLLSFGDKEEDIAEARELLRRHSEGGAGQDDADNALYELINDRNSSVGKVLRDIAYINEEQYRQGMAIREANMEANIERDFPMERMYANSDISDNEIRQRLRSDYMRQTGIMDRVYRGGGRKNTEAWTKNERGADVGSGIRIAIDHQSTISEMLKTHYIVGGISQGVGAPGESEILFIKKRK